MTSTRFPKKLPDYCYCSELPHTDIVARQQVQPLPFATAMETHCNSAAGCGRCLWPLEQLFRKQNLYQESDSQIR